MMAAGREKKNPHMETKEEEKVLFSIETQHELMSHIVSFAAETRFSVCLSANIWTHNS